MRLLRLTGRRARGALRYAIVDEADYDAIVAAGPWHLYTPSKARGKRKRKTHYARKVFYVWRPEPGDDQNTHVQQKRSVYLHRWLWERWGLPPAEHIDHVGGNGLDVRREKLRAATHAENQRARGYTNSLGVKGVKRCGQKFIARITVDGSRRTLGRFETAAAAAGAYDRAARELHGAFAHCNEVVVCDERTA